ncbi:TetR/AcrR family transcriptional regulator [Candidatus Mycobacterium wuenschmannii]|uniref:TetR/AcrR family transcriptional regulator n=1 Tax=Candidatus Mycobacterium wuenschmannii TaxID=3027808 RepID=A0ABY8VXL7_9MYCO|nr:TetR/AcrR family transcriptional regulator [Candidatus Mycobacterium wuenschmannii]WIM86888.1 TetR/AcrR family transcriptional regulator [Candidatus Mycobacterium wuenschmannii]
MAPTGRAGARRTQKRDAILAAAEQLLLEQGHAAMTFRSIAAAADVAPGLVQYYFPSVEDLLATVLRRSTDRIVADLGDATRSPHPLRAVWAYANDQRGSALLLEFLALANHRPQLRAVLGEGGERVRQALLASVTAHWEPHNRDRSGVPAAAALFLLVWIPRMIMLEESLGTQTGHAETLTLVQRFLDNVEPLDNP